MIDLIDMDEAKLQLHITDDLHDDDIALKITQASAICMNYLKLSAPLTAWEIADTSPIEYDVPADIKFATLLMLSEMYENREASVANIISPAVEALLIRHRDPAMA